METFGDVEPFFNEVSVSPEILLSVLQHPQEKKLL